MTRPAADYSKAMDLIDAGLAQAEVARRTGIPRSTIRTWLAQGRGKQQWCPPCPHVERVSRLPAYAYLLGLYLGDGCISAHARGVYRLRIALDVRYPGIIAECAEAMAMVLPNPVGTVTKVGCLEVNSYSRHWPCLFPQHGLGQKHLRPIRLEPWQHDVAVLRYPRLLLRGLIHSDGWRGTNVAVTPNRRYFYPRYEFSNRSDDIRAIFSAACGQIGVACKPSNRWVLSVARAVDVACLDEFIGPKR